MGAGTPVRGGTDVFAQSQNVRCVTLKRSGDKLDIANEMFVTRERRTERRTKGEAWVKWLWD